MQHSHLQLNIKNTMAPSLIRADVEKAFAQQPDTIVFNECKTVAHLAIHEEARKHGYGVLIPGGSMSQVVVVWRTAKYRLASTVGRPIVGGKPRPVARAVKVSRGRSNVQPDRPVVLVELEDIKTREHVLIAGTHTIASGWTGAKRSGGVSDAWRRRKWEKHVEAMKKLLRAEYEHVDVIIWSGDMNRPRPTFPGHPFARFRFPGAKTAYTVLTGATHGKAVYDYVGVISKRRKVGTMKKRVIPFNSDHNGVFVRFHWKHK